MKKLLSLILAFALICTLIPAVSAYTPELQLAGKTGIYVGERIQWSANQWVSWNSGNPGVATIDSNGKIVAHRAGKTNITATAANGAKKTVMLYVYNDAYTVKLGSRFSNGTTEYIHKTQSFTLGLRQRMSPIIYIDNSATQLGVAFEYCGNKYINLDHVIITVGGRSFKYVGNAIKDYSNGNLVEYIIPNFSGVNELNLLANIAAAPTTVKFVGSNGSSTLTLSTADRQAIGDALKAYLRMTDVNVLNDYLKKIG
ncbi:MAG: hypothetical protein E7473_09665 [Ruminococcaceae bacterium]|nr:hypothetical protein [Oscillospiraceae bacterium]